MILAYALGGGLGHVTRVRATRATLGWDEPLVILASNPAAADVRVRGDAEVLLVPPAHARDPGAIEAFVRDVVHELAPGRVLLDTFPRGILGELGSGTFGDRPVVHVARALRWAAYTAQPTMGAARAGHPSFECTHLVEPVGVAQRTALARCSATVADLDLRDVPEPARAADGTVVADLRAAVGDAGIAVGDAPLWLVVHSGPDEAVLELVAYARESAAHHPNHQELEAATRGLRGQLHPERRGAGAIVVVSPHRPTGLPARVAHLDLQPIWPLFDQADHLVVAGGCNTLRQVAPYRARVHVLPFDRRFDDQYARSRRFRGG